MRSSGKSMIWFLVAGIFNGLLIWLRMYVNEREMDAAQRLQGDASHGGRHPDAGVDVRTG